jgi:hypothetical protein
MKALRRNSDLAIAALLVICGLLVLRSFKSNFDAGAISALAGALFGGAAVLGGNWLNREQATEDLAQRRSALNALIAAELVSVAAGYMSAKHFVDAALTTKQAGGNVPDHVDMSLYMPRGMPFTDSLGSDLLTLDRSAIDAIATLRSNLAITRMNMEAITEGRDHFGFLQISALAGGIRHDIGVLADAFAHIAPARQFRLSDRPAEPATAILRRLANQATGH